MLRFNPKKLPANMDVALEVDGKAVSRLFSDRLAAPNGLGLS